MANPNGNNNNPKSASFKCNRSLANGTIGAQLESPKPHTRNINWVAILDFFTVLETLNVFFFANLCVFA